MNNELNITYANQEYNVFFQAGFYSRAFVTPRIHKHNYTEIHLIYGGGACFNIGEETYAAESGDMLIIPRRTLHCCKNIDEETKHSAFQISCGADNFSICKLPKGIMSDFFSEISKTECLLNYTAVSAYIQLFLSHYYESRIFANRIGDYGFLINEFFSRRYGEDVEIEDLAKELHLSLRQTERLVLLHTGNTFGRELSSTRIAIAKHLIKTTSMKLTDIAEYVGYRSYAGFYKAMKKRNN